jgi:hypothetical protein
MYKAFIDEPSTLYADALLHELSDVSKVVGLYAMISKMRVLSPIKTVERVDEVARMIINTYSALKKTLPELQDMVNRVAIDVLQTFSEAARQEFRRLRV